MKPLRLYLQDFMCHEKTYINFEEFDSALILGRKENNDNYSNGVGKSTIFKAIEYVLFNQSDINLEKIIRDETNSCNVVLDIWSENKEYRISRSRTKRGISDLSLFERTAVLEENETNHDIFEKPISHEKFWKNISSRRTSDTEQELAKLIKINFKSFRSSVNFLQNDFSGLATLPPEKRKGILNEALNLSLYPKLSKLAKEKFSDLSKERDKIELLMKNLGNPEENLNSTNLQLKNLEQFLSSKNEILNNLNLEVLSLSNEINQLSNLSSGLENKSADLLNKEKSLNLEKIKLENSIKEYHGKKSEIIKSAKQMAAELQELKNNQEKLSLNYSEIESLSSQLISLKEQLTRHQINIKNKTGELEELMIPIPDESICKHCRQELTDQHKQICRESLKSNIQECRNNLNNSKDKISLLTAEVNKIQQSINSLTLSKQKLDRIILEIPLKNKELANKKSVHDEYVGLLNNFSDELNIKNQELNEVQNKLKTSSDEEKQAISSQILEKKNKLSQLSKDIQILNEEILLINNKIAIARHNIERLQIDLLKKEELKKSYLELNKNQLSIYPIVIQAFSSSGIPNLIIQTVLDDLQIEANNLLLQLKPGLQLSFIVEKTKNGVEDETLDINYSINGKDRHYKQLSGAQQIAVMFSLKLGLSFLLQKMHGTDIKFLLLDEIDQSLDKAGIDAFVEIVKFFQKDFTILIITHNDQLKDKFSHAILVEQDANLVSRARNLTY